MNHSRYAEHAARLLARTELRQIPSPQARERGLATIERALRARHRRSRLPRIATSIAAVAACAAAGFALRGLLPRASSSSEYAVVVRATSLGAGARLLDQTGETRLGIAGTLHAGSRIDTDASGGAELQLSTGTRLSLGNASVLTVASHDRLQSFELSRGQLDAHVARLGPAERFVIDTPDTQVEVRGTAFRLNVLNAAEGCGAGARTRLQVQEGVVEVRSGTTLQRVGAGESWPPDCLLDVHHPESRPALASASDASAVSRSAREESPKRHPRALSRSTLATETAQFERAVRAKQSGDSTAALAAYADFIERFPSSPLAENARVHRMRLLVTLDPAAAGREARLYLARYPNGFARREAQRLLGLP